MNTSKPLTVVVLCALLLCTNACSSTSANLDFSLTNLTGGTVKLVYLSPSSSPGWQENILAGSDLKSGDTLKIGFKPNETATTWDLRVEAADGQYAEWKDLKLADISEITLVVERSPQLQVIAELE